MWVADGWAGLKFATEIDPDQARAPTAIAPNFEGTPFLLAPRHTPTPAKAVEYHGSDHAGHAQAGDQRGCFAVSPSAAARPRGSGHGCGSCWSQSRFVDEHQPRRIEIELALEPCLSLAQDVGAAPLGRVANLSFLRVIPWRAKKWCSVEIATVIPRLAKLAAQLVQCDVAPCSVQRQDRVPVCLDSPRSRVATSRLGSISTRAAALVVPADHRRGRHTESPRRSPANHPLVNRSQRSRSQIH